jgi:hypothetical protein
MVRVAAIDPESLPKALIVLSAANNMAQANSGHMLVFQPTAISSAAAAEPPRVLVGSMVMYTTQIMAGEGLLLTFVTAFEHDTSNRDVRCVMVSLCDCKPAASSWRTCFTI